MSEARKVEYFVVSCRYLPRLKGAALPRSSWLHFVGQCFQMSPVSFSFCREPYIQIFMLNFLILKEKVPEESCLLFAWGKLCSRINSTRRTFPPIANLEFPQFAKLLKCVYISSNQDTNICPWIFSLTR